MNVESYKMIIEVNEIRALFDEFYFIDEKLPQVAKVNENPPQINFQGGNTNGLVFLFGEALSAEDNDMIQKLIHNALKIKMEEMVLVQMNSQSGISFQQVIDIIKPKQMVLWGGHETFPQGAPYEVIMLSSAKLIKVDAVNRFHNDIPLKTALWNSIQQLLNG
jgi:hypothetical protein